MGMVVYSVMIALGEMATLFPVSGGFMHYASRCTYTFQLEDVAKLTFS
jgi:amino acid permease